MNVIMTKSLSLALEVVKVTNSGATDDKIFIKFQVRPLTKISWNAISVLNVLLIFSGVKVPFERRSRTEMILHWKPIVVIMPTWSSLTSPQIVVITTCEAPVTTELASWQLWDVRVMACTPRLHSILPTGGHSPCQYWLNNMTSTPSFISISAVTSGPPHEGFRSSWSKYREKLFCCNYYCNHKNQSHICTCHDSWVACAKVWIDLIIIFDVRT